MEAEDKVSSELNSFSKKDNKKCFINKEGRVKIDASYENLNKKSCQSEENNSSTDDEDLPYTCLLGANGQVILWNPESETVLSRFEYSNLHQMMEKTSIKEEDSLVVIQKTPLFKKDGVILIEQSYYSSFKKEHQSATTLDLVGEQVWRGALFLSDFILHNPQIFNNANILEVASGVGLTSIVAAMIAKKVLITDVDKGDIINLITRNVQRNKSVINANTDIKEIDFFDLRTIDDLGKQKDDVTILLAADVVYHNQLTDAFMRAVLYLMKEKPNKVMFIALEKRYVFSIEDMDTVAPCYEHFMSQLDWLKCQDTNIIDWNIEQLSPDFPQYFTYERTSHLVLWKIEAIGK